MYMQGTFESGCTGLQPKPVCVFLSIYIIHYYYIIITIRKLYLGLADHRIRADLEAMS